MSRKRHQLVVEGLEGRQLLTTALWFVDSGQSLGTNTDGADFGDLDGDGDLDLLVGCRNWPGGPACSETVVWLNDGSGFFSKGWSVERTNIGSLALGDLDGDGDLDAYITKGSPNPAANPTYTDGEQTNEVWLNDGQGNFEDTGQRLGNAVLGAVHIVLQDVDGDEDLDALTAYPVGSTSVWLNDGEGRFTDSGQRLKPSGWAFAIAVGDVDADGDVDAYVAGGHTSPSDSLHLNDGKGGFTDSRHRGLDNNSTNAAWLADLDGDGDLDVFLANGPLINGLGQPNRVYLNDGKGTFTDSGQRLGNAISTSAVLADLDGDGDLDAFVTNGTRHFGRTIDQANEIWLNDGTGVFTLALDLGNAASYRVALGDIDNDGDLDAFIGNIGQANQIWINTQVMPFSGLVQAVEAHTTDEQTLLVSASGSGNASALGRFTLTYNFQVDLSTLTGSGPAQFTAANGDSLFANVTGKADPTENPDVLSIRETFAITGGTGRFAGAAGSVTSDRLLNSVTGVTSGSFVGTLHVSTQPMRGSIEAVESFDPQPPTMFVDASGSGTATHLGNFTVSYEVKVDLSTFVGSGRAHFVAANGDSLFTEIVGQGTDPAVNPISTIVETHTITGGTGRFAGATGSFTLNRWIDTVTGITSGSFDGDLLLDTIPVLPGDIDNDGKVQFADFLILSDNFGRTDATPSDGDLNDDGTVDFADFLILSNNFGQSRQPVAAQSDATALRHSASSTDELFKALEDDATGEDSMFETGGN